MPQQFDVHVFTVVRLTVPGMSADSPEAAIAAALEHSIHRDLDRALQPLSGEWAEEHSHFLVDVVGDPEYGQSRWFHSRDQPLLDLLRALVEWSTGPRDPAQLESVLERARAELAPVV